MFEVILGVFLIGVGCYAVKLGVDNLTNSLAGKERTQTGFSTEYAYIVAGVFAVGCFVGVIYLLTDIVLLRKAAGGFSFTALVGTGFLLFEKTVYESRKKINNQQEKKETPKPNASDLASLLNVPSSFLPSILTIIETMPIYKYAAGISRDKLVDAINLMAKSLPPHGLLELADEGISWKVCIKNDVYSMQEGSDERDYHAEQRKVIGDQFQPLVALQYNLKIPDQLRTEHQHIVAGSGHGKSQTIQSMIIDDLDRDCSIVVIDSQGDMLNELAPRVDPDRLVLIDPETCPPALNLFNGQTTEQQVSTTIELYEYIFSALDAEMTSKQQTYYRFVTRLLLVIPDSNIHTMREILEPGVKHQEHLDKLDDTTRSFFESEYNNNNRKQTNETREQILRRLYTVLENATLSKMLGSTKSNLDIPELLNSGKVILISTAKNFLKQTGSSLFGRIFIAQVMQAVMDRKTSRKRTYLYIDEFQDYAEDSHVLFNLLEQSRKFNLGLIMAHQYLGQLPPKLQQSVSANTAIKYAGGVSAEDASKLANQMQTDREFVQLHGKGNFCAYLRGYGAYSIHIKFGRLGSLPILEDLRSIQVRMNNLYGVKEVVYQKQEAPLLKVAESDVIEKGDWQP